MSPERKEYYRTKQRRMAFYIVENETKNEENPPTVSAIIGLDKELEAAFFAAKREPLEKQPPMKAGIRVNRDIISDKNTKDKKQKEKQPIKKSSINKDSLHFPSLPTQWINNLDIIIPKAEFGPFTPTRRKSAAR